MSNQSNLRIHPAIGMARVGNSEKYYLGPETMAADPLPGQDLTGGLPIKPNTESTPITDKDLRDQDGKLKKQAARFKIYHYRDGDTYSYPSQKGREIVIGSNLDGKIVKDIIWTVHLANKKANCWMIDEDANEGIKLYENGTTPPMRNPDFPPSPDPSDPARLSQLVIDAGPRAVKGTSPSTQSIKFDKNTKASYADVTGNIVTQANYPISFPASDGEPQDYNATSQPIDYLGEILTDEKGRLIVLGGFGLACGFDNEGNPDPNTTLPKDVDNNNWLDDTSDGPVTAVLIFNDGSARALDGSAWVVSTDPAYAPQTLNAVSLWDNVYTTWLENFDLVPSLYSNGSYLESYKPNYNQDVFPIFNAAHMQMWNTNLNDTAIRGHKKMFSMSDAPPEGFSVMPYIRKPDDPEGQKNGSLQMPLSLGDSAKSFLTVTTTQYFYLQQWDKGNCVGASPMNLSPGEQLDKTILVNCLGGRFSPGIDMTFIVTDPNLYNSDWKNPEIGAFRINAEKLDYSKATKSQAFLGVGYIPLRKDPVQPGDICKFMSIPWHTDYNSCATHNPAPNPGGELLNNNLLSGVNLTLFWSWPAQRPVAVYTYEDLQKNSGELPQQRFSVRGNGTQVTNQDFEPHTPGDAAYEGAAMQVGRYQKKVDMLNNWHRIGIVIQGAAIEDYEYDKSFYLEVASQFEKDESNLVIPWRNKVNDKVYPPKD